MKTQDDNICIWNEKSQCENCELQGKLHCHPYFQHSLYFILAYLAGFIPAILGILLAQISLLISLSIIGGWVIFTFFFFSVWESKVLCSHCPHYSNRSQKILHCGINSGMYKITSYNPNPMTSGEKVQFLVGAAILLGYFLPFLFILDQYIYFILTILGIILWVIVIQLKHCKECINFSCPLNRTPDELKQEFLRKNPMINDAFNSH
jgi:uncharacterized membrane protein